MQNTLNSICYNAAVSTISLGLVIVVDRRSFLSTTLRTSFQDRIHVQKLSSRFDSIEGSFHDIRVNDEASFPMF